MRVQRVGICDNSISILQDLDMSWRGCRSRARAHKKKLAPRGSYFSVIEKHTEDVKQNQEIDPDLLEAIIRPTDTVKEESRRILFEMSQSRSRGSPFWMTRNQKLPAGAQHSQQNDKF